MKPISKSLTVPPLSILGSWLHSLGQPETNRNEAWVNNKLLESSNKLWFSVDKNVWEALRINVSSGKYFCPHTAAADSLGHPCLLSAPSLHGVHTLEDIHLITEHSGVRNHPDSFCSQGIPLPICWLKWNSSHKSDWQDRGNSVMRLSSAVIQILNQQLLVGET